MINSYRSILASIVLIYSLNKNAYGEEANVNANVEWQTLQPHLELAAHQKWNTLGGSIVFTAIRFHLGYFSLSLVDVKSFFRANRKTLISKADKSRYLTNSIDVGVGAIFNQLSSDKVVAVAPAGWSTNLRSVEQAGLLKVTGTTLSPYLDGQPGLSAILCLNSPTYAGKQYDYQIPTFYRQDSLEGSQKISACRDAVQVGPRILEDPNVNDHVDGIKQSERSNPPSIRVVFAVDSPNRGNVGPKSRDNARNGYLIVTESPAHLYDVQEMLKAGAFYPERVARPWWAMNLAGGSPTGFIVKTGPKDEFAIGNIAGVIGSAMVLKKR